MELGEKLQELRKQRGLTQEELAAALFVSRTAVSKWESGRGLPSIDSLQALSRYFGVSIDHLLSTDEVLYVAAEDVKEHEARSCDQLLSLVDCGAALLLFLPVFGQQSEAGVRSVSLLALTGISPWLRGACIALVTALTLLGVANLALQNGRHPLWMGGKRKLSLLLGVAGALLFTSVRQPYAAALALVALVIKASMLLKRR